MEWSVYLRTVLVLVFVLGLITGAAWLARHFGLGQGGRVGPGLRRTRRLKIVETLSLDGRRRLVLLRRDGTEHLLLVGGTTDIVIERGIPPASAEEPGP